MNCWQVRDLLGAFCAGELDRDQAQDVESHLASCPGCAGERQRMATVLNALRNYETLEPGPRFAAKVSESIDRWEAGSRLFWVAAVASYLRRHRRVLATAVVVFAISLASGLYVLHNVTGVSEVQFADRGGPSESFVMREIPQAVNAEPDTVFDHFVTGDRPSYGFGEGESYTYTPVVRTVSQVEPTF